MRFLMITYPDADAGEPSVEALAELGKLTEEGTKAGWLLDGGGITVAEAAPRVRLADGKFTVTDGPFTESKELIAGYAIVQLESQNEAVALSKRYYETMGGGEGEIRQMFSAADFTPPE